MTRSVKTFLPVIVAVVAAGAFWHFAITPKREQIAVVDAEIAEQEALISQADAQLATYTKARARYKVNYNKLARLGKAVPADDDVRSLLVQLDATAKQSKVDFEAINVTATTTTPTPGGAPVTTADGLAPPPGTVPVGSAGFSAMPFTFSFSGSYFRLSNFFHRLEDFVTVQNDRVGVTGRLLLLGSIAVTSEGNTETELGNLKADIGAAAYIVPPTVGVAGATPGPDPAPGSVPAATDGSTTPPTTTASITGVQ